jgi:hypothetical protein
MAAVAVGIVVVVAVRGLVPERFPALDGNLAVRLVGDTDADRDRQLAASGAAGHPPAGRTWVVADARWSTAGPIPQDRRSCRLVVLTTRPGGRAPVAAGSSGAVDTGWPPEAARVLAQYREVLPPELVRQLDAQPLALVAAARTSGGVSLAWAYPSRPEAAAAAAQVRLLVAPVCSDAVHGLVELGRPR